MIVQDYLGYSIPYHEIRMVWASYTYLLAIR